MEICEAVRHAKLTCSSVPSLRPSSTVLCWIHCHTVLRENDHSPFTRTVSHPPASCPAECELLMLPSDMCIIRPSCCVALALFHCSLLLHVTTSCTEEICH